MDDLKFIAEFVAYNAVFISSILALNLFNRQPQHDHQLNIPVALTLGSSCYITAAAAYKAPQRTNIANNNNPNPNSIKLLISKAKKPELSGPSR